MSRRKFCAAMAAFCLTQVLPLPAMAQPGNRAPIRIGLTPVFLDDQTAFVNAWRTYLESRLKRPVVFVQRASYREIVDLMRNGKLDFAWLCGYPYVRNKQTMNLLAVPVYQGKPVYHSYLIVPASDRQTRSIADLRDKVFAFSDPDSNSGYLVPVYDLYRMQEKPSAFFSKTFFTWAHRKVVVAVADGLAQGGAVDGYVWDMLALQHPELTSQARIVEKSAEFGFPPFVAGKTVAPEDVSAMRKALLAMPQDEEGAKLLRQLQLDGFVTGDEHLFDSIARMMRAIMDK
ncbi:MAG: ABC transporter substrate-binding protein [Nitrosomonadales bacterium]|nr:MAG: ABC transporter substrate-binding protein [Nitrosomonadales bacterium]